MSRGKDCCGYHYVDLSDDLRNLLKAGRGVGNCSEAHRRVVEYFESRMVGDHQRRPCRNCGEDIIWLVKRDGGNIAVNADDVEPDDDQITRDKHTPHFVTCKEAQRNRMF